MTAQNAQVNVRRSGKKFFKSPVKLRHLVWSTYLISSWNWVFEWSPFGKVFSLPHGHLVRTENDHPNTGIKTQTRAVREKHFLVADLSEWKVLGGFLYRMSSRSDYVFNIKYNWLFALWNKFILMHLADELVF